LYLLQDVTALMSPSWSLVEKHSKEGWFTSACSDQDLSGTQAGVNRPSLLRFVLYVVSLLGLLILWAPAYSQSLAPEILKVDPPSWWVGSSADPIRLLIRGRNLHNSQIQIVGEGVRVVGTVKVNEKGTYAFVDVSIAPNTQKGKRDLQLRTPQGLARATFEVLSPVVRRNRFQGFSSADVLYLIMLDRFSDGDESNNDPPQSRGLYDRKNKFYYHGGDLQGVINHLDYLKDLGITSIWLTPWYDNYDRPNEVELKEDKPSSGFHGYNPQDFYTVEEHFGTLEKLRELVDRAHIVGLKVIQDQVMNHTGPYHPWVNDPPTPTWFNGTKQSHLNNAFQTWTLHDPRPVELLKRETMEGWFLNFLPDLNQSDPEVARYLIQNTLWWIGTTGVDGIRMDTWQYVPNSFWKKWTAAVKKEFPNFKVVGEVKDGDVVHTSFFQGGAVRFDGIDSGLDSLLDFPLFYPIRHAFGEGKALDEVPKTLAKDYLYTNPNILVTLLGGHDDGRFMSEHGATIVGLKLANAFVLTTRGIPQLYYGDEIAMTGPDEPTTRADFPGGFPGDTRNAFTREGRSREEEELFDFIRRLTKLHTELEPLRTGSLVNLHVAAQQYAYGRIAKGEVAIMVFNNDDKAVQVEFDVAPVGLKTGTTLVDRLGISPNVAVQQGKLKLNLPQRSVSIFVRK